jgi:hypothetical protein
MHSHATATESNGLVSINISEIKLEGELIVPDGSSGVAFFCARQWQRTTQSAKSICSEYFARGSRQS